MTTILITGCSTGIGYYCANALRADGYRVIATARQQPDVDRLIKEGFLATQLDLECSHSIDTALQWAINHYGRIDALFNNGAYGQPGAVEDLTRVVLTKQFETNLFGTHELTCKILKIMRKQGHGRIIQNSSVLGLITMKYRGAYNASKFALEGLTDTLRQELHGSNIHISLIEPGPIESKFRENAYQAFKANIDTSNSYHQSTYACVEKRLATHSEQSKKAPFTLGPDAVYKALKHALEARSPKARYYVTFPTWLFAYLRRILPTSALDWILRRVSDDENKAT